MEGKTVSGSCMHETRVRCREKRKPQYSRIKYFEKGQKTRECVWVQVDELAVELYMDEVKRSRREGL